MYGLRISEIAEPFRLVISMAEIRHDPVSDLNVMSINYDYSFEQVDQQDFRWYYQRSQIYNEYNEKRWQALLYRKDSGSGSRGRTITKRHRRK